MMIIIKGPYILFWGAVATILSKEIFVYWADTSEQLVFLAAVIAASKLYGKQIGQFLDNLSDAKNKEMVSELDNATKGSLICFLIFTRNNTIKKLNFIFLSEIDNKIKENEALQSLPEANKIIHAAKKVFHVK